MQGKRVRSVAQMVALCLFSVVASSNAAEDPRKREPTGWDVRIAPEGEPGEPFEMTGLVRYASGKPVPGAKVFFYHAMTSGAYTAPGSESLRIAGSVRTDEKGRYKVRSVFPGSYGGFAAHVHYEVLSPQKWFGQVEVRKKGSKAGTGVEVPRDADGVWRLNIHLRPAGSENMGSNPLSRAAADSARWK